tara:strand:+ start:10075 stop:10185 length:111 start_codon:yes stop_codon:yes gene_type:complete
MLVMSEVRMQMTLFYEFLQCIFLEHVRLSIQANWNK